ncbi:MAG: hypothetical protein JEZ09_08575 [Salinivirgaceae bacterium]|nr:hypothetical protein [Salinivirgaceae bacterium]
MKAKHISFILFVILFVCQSCANTSVTKKQNKALKLKTSYSDNTTIQEDKNKENHKANKKPTKYYYQIRKNEILRITDSIFPMTDFQMNYSHENIIYLTSFSKPYEVIY